MQTLVLKSTGSPMADMKRKECLEAVNQLSDNEIKNLAKLIASDTARGYLKSDLKFQILKPFM